MNDKKRPNRNWRINYTVIYKDESAVAFYRKPILGILKGISLVRGVDCAVSYEHQFYDEQFLNEHPALQGQVVDLVYFRSRKTTKIRPRDFRKMIDFVFEEQQFLELDGYSFEVGAQTQKNLHLFPFPTD